MHGNPWWWPKSHLEIDRLLDRIDRFNTDIVLFKLRQLVVFVTGCTFALVMSLSLVIVTILVTRHYEGFTLTTLMASCLFGGISALLAHQIDPDVFLEMAEVFLGIPMSRRSWTRLTDEFGIRP